MPLGINGVNAMSWDFSEGKQVIKFGNRSNGSRVCLFLLKYTFSKSFILVVGPGTPALSSACLLAFVAEIIRNLPLMLRAHDKK